VLRFAQRALCFLAFIPPAFGQTVTATALVKVDGKVERVRKINERWWSDDNRQMFPPNDPKGMFGLWIIDNKSAGNVFYHHRPVDLARAESLHLMMSPETVRQVMGEPNEALIKPDGLPGFYFYYAAEGTSVTVRFMQICWGKRSTTGWAGSRWAEEWSLRWIAIWAGGAFTRFCRSRRMRAWRSALRIGALQRLRPRGRHHP
jgi:hypothetical protein